MLPPSLLTKDTTISPLYIFRLQTKANGSIEWLERAHSLYIDHSYRILENRYSATLHTFACNGSFLISLLLENPFRITTMLN